MRLGLVFCFVLSLGVLCTGNAQADAVCSNTPGDGDWISCTEGAASTNDIDIDVDGVAISTTNDGEHGIFATHAGGTATTPVNIMIDVTGTSAKNTISATAIGASQTTGISGAHTGTGDVDIDVTGVGISTAGASGWGVHGSHTGTGNVDITIEGTTTGRTISTTGAQAHGVFGEHSGTGNVDIDLEDIAITTTGLMSGNTEGVRVEHTGDGNVAIDATGVSISTVTSPRKSCSWSACWACRYREHRDHHRRKNDRNYDNALNHNDTRPTLNRHTCLAESSDGRDGRRHCHHAGGYPNRHKR